MPRKRKVKEEEKVKVIFCYTCRTDLRPSNLNSHRKWGHRIKILDRDPRRV